MDEKVATLHLKKVGAKLTNYQKNKQIILALEQKVLSNQMPIAIKDSKIDITSEKLTKELAKQFTKYLKGGEFVFFIWRNGRWQNYLC